MIIPIRCYTCNKLLADKYDEYNKLVSQGLPLGQVMDKIGLKRYCCRRIFMGHVPLLEKILLYDNTNF